MRYKVFNLDQNALITLGLNTEDALILDWIINFKDGGSMKRRIFEDVNDIGYWIDYGTIINELPIIFKQPTRNMTEEELLKLDKANKTKLRRMLKGNLSKVLTRKKQSVVSDKGFKGSNVYVVIDRHMIDVLKGKIEMNTDAFIEEEETKEVAENIAEDSHDFTFEQVEHLPIVAHIEKALKGQINGYNVFPIEEKNKIIVDRLNAMGWKIKL